MNEVWRVFAAIELTDEIKGRMTETARLLAEAGWKAKWVSEQQMHMTVRFYGDLEIPTVETLQVELRTRIAKQPAFELQVNRLGAFPSPNRPRVIWLGVYDPFAQLPGLKTVVEDASEAADIKPERDPYKPHLTIGRLDPRFRIEGEDAVAAFQEYGVYDPISWVPDSVSLIRSKLGRGGAQHTVIESFPFARPDRTVSDPRENDDTREASDDESPADEAQQ